MFGRRTTIILGAGASRDSEINGSKFPLQNDFFLTLFKEPVYIPGSWYHFDLYLQIKYGFNIDGLKTHPLSVENLLKEIDSLTPDAARDLIEGREYSDDGFFSPDGKPKPEPEEFVSGLRSDISRIIHYVISHPQIGRNKTCMNHVKLVASLEPGDAIISFNYDTLIDYALLSQSKWSFCTGYGVLVKAILTDWPEDQKLQNMTLPDVLLLKLHGSVNWSRSLKDLNQTPPPLSISTNPGAITFNLTEAGKKVQDYVYVVGPTKIQMADPGHHNYKTDEEALKISAGYFLPPYPIKDIASPVFIKIWKYAEEVLSKSDAAIIIGYSLPPSDHHVTELFSRVGSMNQNLKIEVVDPQAGNHSWRRRIAHAFKKQGASNIKVGGYSFTSFVSTKLKNVQHKI